MSLWYKRARELVCQQDVNLGPGVDQSAVGDALPRGEVRGGGQFCDCLRLHCRALPYGDPEHSRGWQLLLWQDRGDHRTSDSAPRHRLDSIPAPHHGHRLSHRGHPRIRLPTGDSREEASVVNARSSKSLKRNVCIIFQLQSSTLQT